MLEEEEQMISGLRNFITSRFTPLDSKIEATFLEPPITFLVDQHPPSIELPTYPITVF